MKILNQFLNCDCGGRGERLKSALQIKKKSLSDGQQTKVFNSVGPNFYLNSTY